MEHSAANGSRATTNSDIVRWFEDAAANAGRVQAETLRRILQLNWGVEYLRKWFGETESHDLLNMEDSELESFFSRSVPLASHLDLEPYIQRIADGDSALMTRHPIVTLSLSSGTTEGRQKYVPFTRHSAQTTLQMFTLAAAYRSMQFPVREGGRVLEFIYSGKQFKTKGGLTVGTATTHYYSSEEFKLKQERTKLFTCSPPEVISGGGDDYIQITYCHLLLGLYHSDEVEFVTSTFAYSIVQAFAAFEEFWNEICHDIRHGQLSPRIKGGKMRRAVLDLLAPNPELAGRVERRCEELERRRWVGLVSELWPNAKYVYSIMTGAMQPYLRKLRDYAGPELPLISADYGSTESWIGVNVDPGLPPEEVTFAVVPSFSYFEFIPLYRERKPSGEAVPLSRVEVGQQYEIVLTTFTGLYRYRLGDVVEVSSFHKTTPKLNFICRRKLILTINIDKNTEKDLQTVVEKGALLLTKKTSGKAEVVDFTSRADVERHPGHYVIYWEVKGDVEDDVIMGECCREMDESFVDYGYVVSRKAKSIGALELRVVERGTFRKILDYFIGNGAALSQFKTPRCTSNEVLVRILDVSTVGRFFSSAYGG
ncbi:Indole-3-acetic acid-amido synthetase GH3.10 [Linum perenne]